MSGTYAPCWRLCHMPTQAEALAALTSLGIAHHYDIVRCRHCRDWIWIRRPDWSEPA